MSKFIKQILILLSLTALLIIPSLVFAVDTTNDPLTKLDNIASKSSYKDVKATLPETVANIIKTALGFVGIIFLVLTIYGGFKWMTAGGDSSAVTKAQDVLTKAIIGLIIIVSAYAITYFVFNYLANTNTSGA